jgi:ataxia telangiectasia mutated family protein
MDIDSMFDTHQSASRGNAELSLAHREHLSISLDDETLLSTTIVRLFFTTAFETDDAEIPHIPPRFLVHLSELSSAEFIVCCSDIGDVLQSDFQPTPEDAKKLLEQISSIVGDKLYTTCEVAQIAAVAIMKGLLPLWSSGTVGPLEQQAFDLYEWFVVEIPKAVPSPAVRIALADFLVSLMRCSVHYGEERGLRSPRSSIFDLVQRSPLAVKFHTARLLPDMFSLFIWPDHNRILEDLLDCIPNSLGWNEGQAFRLSVLANVGARWPNLLRSCLYYIVEVPGVMPGAVDYAEKCVFDLSQKLNLADPQALFDLFGSQILYTWLEVQSFEHFPFRIFGYSELNDFLVDAEVEIAALMVMRNRDAEVERLAVAIGVTTEDLIASSFTKIIAYSIAHDLQHPHVASGSPYQTGEVRIRNLLGRDRYRALIEKHFVDIISASFRHMDHEVDMEKSLSRQPEFVQSAKTLRSIKSCGASSLALPPNQQPNFKAKYLSRQISHICSRTQYALESIFTAPMFVSIARSLLNSINPALGSLHTCSIVRKIRVLLGFAGPVSLSGYPLEMIMHGLRSLVVDTECRPDVIGILKYLMERGAPYLATVPKFTAGFVLSYYGTLKALFDRPASSYSQQSQYLGTVSEVQDVNDWLSGYLQRYQETVPGKLRKSFETITNAAKHARSTRVDNQNPTGELLLEFLRDEREGRKLLVPETADLAFSLLFEQFTPPDSYRDDELGSDTRAVRYSGVLWALVRRCNLSSNFFTWAARAIGRAFAASGSVEPSLLRETDLSQILAYGKEAPPGGHSETSLLRQLYSHTLVDHGKVTGLAEICLRLTLGSLRSEVDTVLVAATNAIIPPSLRDSSIWTPYCVPPSDQVNIEGQVARQALSPESIHKEEWVQSLSLFLVQTVKKDKLLWPLQHLLTEDAAFAQSAFPFILHVALSSTVHDESMKGKLSAAFTDWLRIRDLESKMRVKLIINSLLYLRTQEYPKEESIVDRALWLDIDNSDIIDAALFCGMHRTALLFTEVAVSMQNSTTRRSSLLELVDSQKVLSIVFQNVDDPDAFYGLQQPASLSSVYNRLDYERDGLKALMFTGAQYDSQMRRGSNMGATADEQLINALAYLNMDGLSHAFLRARHTSIVTNETIDNMYDAARKLEQWDLPVPTSHESSSITLYETLQALSTANTRHSVQAAIDTSLSSALSRLIGGTPGPSTVHSLLQNLAILTEMDEAFSSTSSEEFEDMIKRFESRAKWMPIGR